ncbi:MAG: hypothetical protein LUC41_09275 [Clostridiales bacterium]|nr:hypothetical protein [Clostridiales bacterium]
MKKRLLAICLTVIMSFCFVSSVGYASEADDHDDEVATVQVIETIYLDAATCQLVYDKMCAGESWTSTVLSSVASIILDYALKGTGTLLAISNMIASLNYSATKTQLQKGISSGKGCEMIVYDNATPCILACS